MSKVLTLLKKEIKEALPSFIFFFILFHLLALTKAVAVSEYDLTILRAAGATFGALIVAKSILLVDALSKTGDKANRIKQILSKTTLYFLVVFLFKVIEELIPLYSKHGSLNAAVSAMHDEIVWPVFGITTLWIVFGLILYSLLTELKKTEP